jgi:hypothetical protein
MPIDRQKWRTHVLASKQTESDDSLPEQRRIKTDNPSGETLNVWVFMHKDKYGSGKCKFCYGLKKKGKETRREPFGSASYCDASKRTLDRIAWFP